jgi:hypothetical protein
VKPKLRRRRAQAGAVGGNGARSLARILKTAAERWRKAAARGVRNIALGAWRISCASGVRGGITGVASLLRRCAHSRWRRRLNARGARHDIVAGGRKDVACIGER